MQLRIFKQYLSALRVEKKPTQGVNDKAYQLRDLCTRISKAARSTFKPGRYLSFDEGGIASRSRRNPIRQYNKDKPAKYRVDFFILSDSKYFFVYHLDPYQGKNSQDINVHERCKDFPTTQKVVLNSIISSDLRCSTEGTRVVAMDNRYGAPKLAITLEDWNILSVATIRKNRKGWDSNVMNLAKSSERGSMLVKYDAANRLLAVQWNDNKVVSFVSTLGLYRTVKIRRRIGSALKEFDTQECVKVYQEHMGGVNKGDQIRELGGGFSKGIFMKKWFKKIILGMFDFGMLNAHIAWNMNAETLENTMELTHFKFALVLSEQLQNFKENVSIYDSLPIRNQYAIPAVSSQTEEDVQHCIVIKEIPKKDQPRCIVCSLEKQQMMKDAKIVDKRGAGSERTKKNLVKCGSCNVWLHNSCKPCVRKNFDHSEIQNMTCFEIYHSDYCKGLWNFRFVGELKKQVSKRDHNHEVFMRLRRDYGLPQKISRKRRRIINNSTEDIATVENINVTNADKDSGMDDETNNSNCDNHEIEEVNK